MFHDNPQLNIRAGSRVDRHRRQGNRKRWRNAQGTGKRFWRWVGWGLLATGVIILGRIPYFYLRSWWVGTHLAHTALESRKSHHAKNAAVTKWPSSVLSVIKIPTLGLTAPVIQGIQTPQLDVAVGHLPSSVMPGNAGTSILAAHNATWFRHINQLKAGDLITVVDRHQTLTFRVSHKAIVHVGTPISNSTNPAIILEACYPLNALYLTPYRYMVWANLVSSQKQGQGTPAIPANIRYAPVGIPAAVQAQGLTLATNYMPMGTLTIKGQASPAWRQSNAPLNAADATTTLYFAMLHIAAAHNPTWWNQLAPKIPYATLQPLLHAEVSHYLSSTNEFETVNKQTVQATELKAEVQVNNGTGVTNYAITMTTRVEGEQVSLAKLSLRPMG